MLAAYARSAAMSLRLDASQTLHAREQFCIAAIPGWRSHSLRQARHAASDAATIVRVSGALRAHNFAQVVQISLQSCEMRSICVLPFMTLSGIVLQCAIHSSQARLQATHVRWHRA